MPLPQQAPWKKQLYYTALWQEMKQEIAVMGSIRAPMRSLVSRKLANPKKHRAYCCTLCSRVSRKSPGGVGGPQLSDSYSEADDMCVSFGSLAQQGFLAGFHGRTVGAVKTCFVEKDRQRRAFSTHRNTERIAALCVPFYSVRSFTASS